MIDIVDWITKHVSDLRRTAPWKNAVSVKAPEQQGAGYVIDVDGAHVVGQFIVWTTGAMEATAGAVANGQVSYLDAASSVDEATLNERWRDFCAEILRIEEQGT